TMTVNQPLPLTQASAAHTNSGTIDLTNADLTLILIETSPNFRNLHSFPTRRSSDLTINSGTLNQNGGTLGGPGTLTLNSVTANFATNHTTETTSLVLTGTPINRPSTLTNAAGRTLTIANSTINAPLVNNGTLNAYGG